MTDTYLQMIIALSLVVGTIALLGAALKKKQAKDTMMKVLSYQSLGQKKGIAAVRVGKEVLLVGITSTDLKLLKTVGEEIDQEQGAKDRTAEKATVADITEKLRKLRAMKDTLYAIK